MMIFRDDSMGKTRVGRHAWDNKVEEMLGQQYNEWEIARETQHSTTYVREMRYLLKVLEVNRCQRKANARSLLDKNCIGILKAIEQGLADRGAKP